MSGTVLFQVSDVHFGIEHRPALAWLAEAIARERPDALLCTGDITQRAKRSEYAQAREWFSALGVPVVIEPGNHDMPYYNLFERFRDPFGRYRELARAVGSQPDFPDALLVPLLTTVSAQWRWPWSDGVIREAVLAQTLAALEGLRGDRRMKLVICHHPLARREPGGENPTIGGDFALEALARAGADAVLSGHVHVPFDFTQEIAGRPIRMIGCGTLSNRLRRAPRSYNVLRFDGAGELTVERRDFAA